MPNTKGKTITYDIYNLKGEKGSRGSLNDLGYDDDKVKDLISQVVRVYLMNQKQGNASTKTRGEITGSTRKIYKQKGTGRARHGDIKAPIFIGGGTVFGPRPKDVELKLNKKMKTKAFAVCLVDKIKNNNFLVISGLEKISNKTKEFSKLLEKIFTKNIGKESLLLINSLNKNLLLAARNIPFVDLVQANNVNTYNLLSHQTIIVDKNILDKLFQRIGIEIKKEEPKIKKTAKSRKTKYNVK